MVRRIAVQWMLAACFVFAVLWLTVPAAAAATLQPSYYEVPVTTLTTFFNNNGTANYDGSNNGYVPGTFPGGPFQTTVLGADVNFQTAALGVTNNNIQQSGQTIFVDASQAYAFLWVLTSAVDVSNSTASTNITVNYTDGTSKVIPYSVDDWILPSSSPPSYEGIVDAYRYRFQNGQEVNLSPASAKIYAIQIALNAAKVVRSLTLGTNGDVHIWAMTLTGDQYTAEISSSRWSMPADGTSSANISATVLNSSGQPAVGVPVTFQLSKTSVGSLSNSSPVLTNASGVATDTLISDNTFGIADVSGSISGVSVGNTAQVAITPRTVVILVGGIGSHLGTTPAYDMLTTSYRELDATYGSSKFDGYWNLPGFFGTLSQTGAMLVPFSYHGVTFNVAKDGLSGSETARVRSYSNLVPGQEPRSQAAAHLYHEVEGLHKDFPNAHIVIIGHSNGGLITETFFMAYSSQLSSLGVQHIFSLDGILNGAPNPCALFGCGFRVNGTTYGIPIGAAVGAAYNQLWAAFRQYGDPAVVNKDNGMFTAIGTAGDLIYSSVDGAAGFAGRYSQMLTAASPYSYVAPIQSVYYQITNYWPYVSDTTLNYQTPNTPPLSPNPMDSHFYVLQNPGVLACIASVIEGASGCQGAVSSVNGVVNTPVTSVGQTVTISGTGFGTTPGTVTFSAPNGQYVDGTVTAWSDSQISVTVPQTAVTGPIYVSDPVMVGGLVVLSGGNSVSTLSAQTVTTAVYGQPETVQITALNATGNAVEDVPVSVSDGVGVQAQTTNSSGVATFTITGYGSETLTAYSGSVSIPVSLSWQVPPSMTMVLTASQDSATVNANMTVTAAVYNSDGSAASGQTVNFLLSGSSAASISTTQATTNSQGLATATVTSSSSGLTTVSATADYGFVREMVSTTWVGTTVGQFAITDPTSAVQTGQPALFTVTAEDDSGNVLTNFSDQISLSSSDPNAVLPSSVTFQNGVAQIPITFNSTGIQDLTVTDAVVQPNVTATSDAVAVEGMPVVTSVSPAAGNVGGGTPVTITGSGFTGATAVSFGGTPSVTFAVYNDTQMVAVSPAGSGVVDITVTTPGGTSTVNTGDQFTYSTAPFVTSISPAVGSKAGGTAITITGSGLTGTTAVDFGSTAAASFTVNSDTQITATSPPGSGTVEVAVYGPEGTSAITASDQFTYVGMPTVNSISPGSGPSGGGTSITIAGTNFTGATAVDFGSTAATNFTVNSDTQVTATSPAGSGTVEIAVYGPGGTSATSPSDQFTFVETPATITLTASPTSIVANGSSTSTVTAAVYDSNGTPISEVTVNLSTTLGSLSASSAVTNSAGVVTDSLSSGTTAGTATVTAAVYGTSFSSTVSVTFTPEPVTFTSVTFSGSGQNTQMTINGSGFGSAPVTMPYSGDTSYFSFNDNTKGWSAGNGSNSVGLNYQSWNDGQIQISGFSGSYGTSGWTVSPGDSVTITVWNPQTGQTASWSGALNPSITSIRPASGPTAGGTNVTITGTGFTGATAVAFGTAAATSFTVNSDTQITAVAPAASAGTVDITVTTASGSSTTGTSDQFTYCGAPTVTSISPDSGPSGGGTSITIAGTNFTGATAVDFGSTAAANFTVNSDSQITATSPAGSGTVEIAVYGPGGTSATSPSDQFTFVEPPTVNLTASPTSIVANGTSTSTVTAAVYDSNGNPISGATVNLSTSLGTLSASSAVTNSSGVVTDTLSSGTTAGTATVTAAVYGTSVSSTVSVTFTPEPVSFTSVTFSGSGQHTQMTINGAGFGSAPVTMPYSGDTSYFSFNDNTKGWSAGNGSNSVGLNYQSWNNGQIQISGFSGSYGDYGWTVSPGDSVTITAWNPQTGQTASWSGTLQYTTSVSFTSVTFSGSGQNTQMTINGSGFGSAPVTMPYSGDTSNFQFNDNTKGWSAGNGSNSVGLNYQSWSDGQIQIDGFSGSYGGAWTVSPGDSLTIMVWNPQTWDTASWSGTLTYVAAPSVTSVSPTSGSASGGTSVTITGTGFTGATAVKFGTTAATSFTVNSDTQITATAPAGSAGTVDITVTTAGGTSTTGTSDQFTYLGVPTVSSISPKSGPTGGGTSITIAGTKFTGATAVDFGSTAAANFTVNSDTQITATSPAGSGTVDVAVYGPGGTSATSPSDQFTFVDTPSTITLTASPTSIVANGTSTSTVTAAVYDTNGNPMSGVTVNLSTTLGSLSASSAVTNSSGVVTDTLSSGTTTGTATVTAAVYGTSVSNTVSVTFSGGWTVDNSVSSGMAAGPYITTTPSGSLPNFYTATYTIPSSQCNGYCAVFIKSSIGPNNTTANQCLLCEVNSGTVENVWAPATITVSGPCGGTYNVAGGTTGGVLFCDGGGNLNGDSVTITMSYTGAGAPIALGDTASNGIDVLVFQDSSPYNWFDNIGYPDATAGSGPSVSVNGYSSAP